MRKFRVPRRALLASATAIGLMGTGAIAYSATVPSPDPCDGQYRASYQGLRNYMDCRLDRIEKGIPQVTVTTPGPTVTVTVPGPTVTVTPSSSATTEPSPTSTSTTTTSPAVLDLPRIPWEGGPDYYKQFPGSTAFTNPSVFPIGIWWGDFDSDANVKWDKTHGINFYTQLNGTEDGQLLASNDMYVIQGNNNLVQNLPFSDPHWAGWWLSDEVDGRYDPPSTGQAEVQKQIDAQKAYCPDGGACKFSYANYTGIVTSYYNDTQIAADEKYVNMVPGAVSVDGYYYTDPSCDDPNRNDWQVNAPDNAHCRTAAAYGNFIDNLRARDRADEKLQPLWGFVENGAPMGNGKYIAPAQMKAAAMSQVIHEARGIVWFNQSFSGDCQSSNVLRDAQAAPTGCNKDRVQALGEVSTQIQSLAPVLNTQSYAWDFKTAGAATMLKVKDGSAYVFADVGLNKNPGDQTFTLPAGISGGSVEVVGEGRAIPVADGKFTDQFPNESTYHIYKIALN